MILPGIAVKRRRDLFLLFSSGLDFWEHFRKLPEMACPLPAKVGVEGSTPFARSSFSQDNRGLNGPLRWQPFWPSNGGAAGGAATQSNNDECAGLSASPVRSSTFRRIRPLAKCLPLTMKRVA